MRGKPTHRELHSVNLYTQAIENNQLAYIKSALSEHAADKVGADHFKKLIFHQIIKNKLKDYYEYLTAECRSFLLEEPHALTLEECMKDSLKEYLASQFNEYMYEHKETEECQRYRKIQEQQEHAEQIRLAVEQREIEKAEQVRLETERRQEAERVRAHQAERVREQQAAFTSISNKIINNIASLVDGNNASYQDVVNTGFQSEHATVNIYVRWSFIWDSKDSTVAGGSAKHIHFGTNLAGFNAHKDKRHKDIDHRHYTSNFLDTTEAKGEKGILDASKTKVLFTDRAFSYNQRCNSCAGHGSVTCSGCHGRGKSTCGSCGGSGTMSYLEPVSSSNGLPNGSVTKYTSCSRCFGCGVTTCSACGGGGRRTCGSCRGHGWFLISKQILLLAKSSYSVGVSGDLESTTLRDYILEKLNTDSIYRLTYYSTARTIHQEKSAFHYSGTIPVLQQNFSIKSYSYNVFTYANPPIIFITSHFLDQLFDKQLQAASALTSAGKVEDAKLMQYLVELNDAPLLKKSIRLIVDARERNNQNYSQIIMRDCNGHISNNAAQALSASINTILNSVSPLFHSATWFLGTILAIAISLWQVSNIKSQGIVASAFIALVLISLVGIFTTFTSDFLVKRRARKFSFQHGVKINNSAPFKRLMQYSVVIYVAIYLLILFS